MALNLQKVQRRCELNKYSFDNEPKQANTRSEAGARHVLEESAATTDTDCGLAFDPVINEHLDLRFALNLKAAGLESRAAGLRALIRSLPQEMNPQAENALRKLIHFA